MRIALLAAALALTACGGGHHAAAPACRLTRAEAPSPETGEHSLALGSSCALGAAPHVRLFGLHGHVLPFTYVLEGGAKGSHALLLDKYRCDIRWRDLAHTVAVGGARLDIGRSLLDWCPAEGVSTVVHVYAGRLVRTRPTWRSVFRDVYDGRLDRVWPCATLREAVSHLPDDGPVYSRVGTILGRAAAHACDAQLRLLARGAPRVAVEQALGTPSGGGARCERWTWRPAGGAVDGARVCFAQGRAALVQSAVHG
ncbi:MAG TPA: hypothetical protein VI408_00435 [Gaiellaceae bacterium]